MFNELQNKIDKLDEEIKNLKKDNISLNARLSISEKKNEAFQIIMTDVRRDMNAILDVEKDISKTVDEAFLLLLDAQYKFNELDTELENLGMFLG